MEIAIGSTEELPGRNDEVLVCFFVNITKCAHIFIFIYIYIKNVCVCVSSLSLTYVDAYCLRQRIHHKETIIYCKLPTSLQTSAM